MQHKRSLIQCICTREMASWADAVGFREPSEVLTRRPSFHAIKENLTSLRLASRGIVPVVSCTQVRQHVARGDERHISQSPLDPAHNGKTGTGISIKILEIKIRNRD